MPLDQMEHACKKACSGWQNGFEEGVKCARAQHAEDKSLNIHDGEGFGDGEHWKYAARAQADARVQGLVDALGEISEGRIDGDNWESARAKEALREYEEKRNGG